MLATPKVTHDSAFNSVRYIGRYFSKFRISSQSVWCDMLNPLESDAHNSVFPLNQFHTIYRMIFFSLKIKDFGLKISYSYSYSYSYLYLYLYTYLYYQLILFLIFSAFPSKSFLSPFASGISQT